MKYSMQGESEIIEDLCKKIKNYKVCGKSNVALALGRMVQMSVNVSERCTYRRARVAVRTRIC